MAETNTSPEAEQHPVPFDRTNAETPQKEASNIIADTHDAMKIVLETKKPDDHEYSEDSLLDSIRFDFRIGEYERALWFSSAMLRGKDLRKYKNALRLLCEQTLLQQYRGTNWYPSLNKSLEFSCPVGPQQQQYTPKTADHFTADYLNTIIHDEALKREIIIEIHDSLLQNIEQNLPEGYYDGPLDSCVSMELLQHRMPLPKDDLEPMRKRVEAMMPRLMAGNHWYSLEKLCKAYGADIHPRQAEQALDIMLNHLHPSCTINFIGQIERLIQQYDLPITAERQEYAREYLRDMNGWHYDDMRAFAEVFKISPEEFRAITVANVDSDLGKTQRHEQGEDILSLHGAAYVAYVAKVADIRAEELPHATEYIDTFAEHLNPPSPERVTEFLKNAVKRKAMYPLLPLIIPAAFRRLSPDAMAVAILKTKNCFTKYAEVQPAITEVLDQYLESVGLPGKRIRQRWKESSNDSNEKTSDNSTVTWKEIMGTDVIIVRNIEAIAALEKKQPGAAHRLYSNPSRGIANFHRYPVQMLVEQDRQDIETATEEQEKHPSQRIVILTMDHDWNGAFERTKFYGNIQHQVQRADAMLHIMEAGSRYQVFGRLSAFSKAQKGNAADLLIVQGHSEGTYLRVNHEQVIGMQDLQLPAAGETEKAPIQLSAHARKLEQLRKYAKNVYINGCSAGKREGLAEAIHQQLGVHVQGPEMPSGIQDIDIQTYDASVGVSDKSTPLPVITYGKPVLPPRTWKKFWNDSLRKFLGY